MIYELKFADIGEGVHEGELLLWHVAAGDTVTEDQTLAEVETEKVAVDIASPVSGVVESLEKKEGDIVTVGEVLVKIETSDAAPVETEEEPKKDESLFKPTRPFREAQEKKQAYPHPVLAAPAVRRKAREMGINIADVKGSGPGGRVLFPDLDTPVAVPSVPSVGPPMPESTEELEERIPLRGIRRTVARNMRKSKDMAAHFTVHDEVDMTALDKLRNEAESMLGEGDIKLTYLPIIIKCLIPALQEFPILNSSLDDEREAIVLRHYYNIGIAVDTDDGLIVPVIKNADQKNVWELAAELSDLAQRARSGKLKLDEVQGGTFTITSVGNIGGVMATPIIRWPEVAILGVMRGKLRPVVVEGEGEPRIAIRRVMFLSLSVDHRIVDGATVARFLKRLIQYLENPGLILLREK
ncbi:MAG: dihydrolipoamide acetyltransferase family protein [Promethearchaeota archaeon]